MGGGRWPSALERRPATGRSMVRVPLRKNFSLRNFGNSVYPALPVSFGGDSKSRRSLLSGVYDRGSKRSHQSALECVTVVDSTPPTINPPEVRLCGLKRCHALKKKKKNDSSSSVLMWCSRRCGFALCRPMPPFLSVIDVTKINFLQSPCFARSSSVCRQEPSSAPLT